MIVSSMARSDADLVAGRANAPNGIDIAEFMDWFILSGFAYTGDSAGKNHYLCEFDAAFCRAHWPHRNFKS